MQKQRYPYDAFISHAVEDKIPIANELCERLEQAGLKIWYSGKELNAGDSIKHTIEEGLQLSRFGVIIFSKNYMAKNWPWRELFTLMSREERGHKVILPVLYEITPDELALEHLDFADRFGLKVERGVDYVVERLVDVIQQEKVEMLREQTREQVSRRRKIIKLILGGFVLLLAIIAGWLGIKELYHPVPDDVIVRASIQRHIDEFQEKADLKHQSAITVEHGKEVPSSIPDSLFQVYKNADLHYRNEYTLFSSHDVIKSKKRVEATLETDLDTMVPGNTYKISEPSFFRFDDQLHGGIRSVHYAVVNKSPVAFEILRMENEKPDEFRVVVRYTNPIRYISVTLKLPPSGGIKRHEVELIALLPQEEFTLGQKDGEWVLNPISNSGSE